MERITKTKLKELAKNIDAYYYGGNVYNYENAISCIESCYTSIDRILEEFKTSKYYNRDQLRELIVKYKNLGYKMSCKYLYYSCGINGNSGQLHKVYVYDNEDQHIDTFYIYYC